MDEASFQNIFDVTNNKVTLKHPLFGVRSVTNCQIQ